MRALLAAMMLAVAGPALAEPVTVSKRRQADGSHVLIHETVVAAPASRVWSAISSAEGWRQWAVPTAWAPPGRPDIIETSYTPDAKPGDSTTIQQQLLLRLPQRLMIFRTIKAPARFPDFDTYTNVLSVFELEPVGARRTRVRLIGSPYPDTDAGRRLLTFFEKGNRISLDRLRVRFTKPAPARATTP